MLVKLMEPTNGSILFKDGDYHRDVANVSGSDMKAFRARVQMIFQDPYESMNPRRTIFDTVSEPLAVQKIGRVHEREKRVLDLLRLVGLTPPENFLFRFPHELSGGQRQRVAVARALVMNPTFVVADEPTTALDVIVQDQILKELKRIQLEMGMSMIYISHDIAVIAEVTDSIGVMYAGKMVEYGPTKAVFSRPRHPYTYLLLRSTPSITGPRRQLAPLEGEPPDLLNPPAGCRFHPRCPFATEQCKTEDPPWVDLGDGHKVACFDYERVPALDEALQR